MVGFGKRRCWKWDSMQVRVQEFLYVFFFLFYSIDYGSECINRNVDLSFNIVNF